MLSALGAAVFLVASTFYKMSRERTPSLVVSLAWLSLERHYPVSTAEWRTGAFWALASHGKFPPLMSGVIAALIFTVTNRLLYARALPCVAPRWRCHGYLPCVLFRRRYDSDEIEANETTGCRRARGWRSGCKRTGVHTVFIYRSYHICAMPCLLTTPMRAQPSAISSVSSVSATTTHMEVSFRLLTHPV